MLFFKPWQAASFAFLEPALLYQLQISDASAQWPVQALERLLKGKVKLLCPIWSSMPNHWTLLEGRRASADAAWSFTYRDSLPVPSENALKKAQDVAALLGVLDPLPQPANHASQQELECGWFVLSWMEQIAISEGPASRPYAAELAVSWQQQRLLPLQKSLLLEIEKLSKDKAAAEAKALKLQAQLKASQDKAAKALENSAKLSKRAKQAAEKALHENSMYFHWKDLGLVRGSIRV